MKTMRTACAALTIAIFATFGMTTSRANNGAEKSTDDATKSAATGASATTLAHSAASGDA
jgi:hypothetical protein